MGNGNRSGSLLNFQITANYDMTSTDRDLWQRAFEKASELLWNATEGQLRFGTILVTDDNAGANNAEFILDPAVTGRATATFGDWGEYGRSIQLPAYAQAQVLSIVHELGHHLWALDEEYARSEAVQLNTATTLPSGHGNLVVPYVAPLDEPAANYVGARLLISFAGSPLETRTITANSGSQFTVDAAFTQNPQLDANGWATVQWVDDVECTGDRSTGACIMEFSRTSAGTLQPDGTWEPHPNPVTEFCTTANHDSDTDTAQHDRYAEACWETIADAAGFTDLAGGAPPSTSAADTTAPTGWAAPNWVVTDERLRMCLLLDRSGSMNRNGGARLAGVKTGARFWLEIGAVEGDDLAIVWFSNSEDVRLPLTDFGSLTASDVDVLVADVDARTAAGATNIRDALIAGLGEITGPGTPASVQATLVITDGAHNTPSGTSMLEAVPDYRASNTSIYTLGVGTGGEMDTAGLETMATDTGGSALVAGNGDDATAIQDAMIEINGLLRGGIVAGDGADAGDTRDPLGDLDRLLEEHPDRRPEDRPKLEELTDRFDVAPWEPVRLGKVKGQHRYVWCGLDVEEGAHSATFTLSHDASATFWLYLIDPGGREIHPSDGDVRAWHSSDAPFEFAQIERPEPGQWTVIGLRLDRGPAVHTRAIAAIEHPEINVFARAASRRDLCPVLITAGARHRELLTGLQVTAVVRDPGGATWRFPLADRAGDGDYRTWASLPAGAYRGHVVISSPRNPPAAGLSHAVLHLEPGETLDGSFVKSPSFTRMVPIAFDVGAKGAPGDHIPEDERRGDREPPRPPRDPFDFDRIWRDRILRDRIFRPVPRRGWPR